MLLTDNSRPQSLDKIPMVRDSYMKKYQSDDIG